MQLPWYVFPQNSIFQEASFSLAEAKFAAGGDFNQAVLQNVNKVWMKRKAQPRAQNGRVMATVLYQLFQAQIKVKTKKDNVAGVNLPNFEAFQVGS